MYNFIFAKESYPLNFVVDNNKIYLRKEIKEEDNLSKDQEWVLNHSSYIVEVQISGRSTTIHSGDRYIGCSESNTLEYVGHKITSFEYGEILEIIQKNDICEVRTYYKEYKKAKTIQCYSKVKNISNSDFTLEYISSFVQYGVINFDRFDKATLSIPSNSWFMECQWKKSILQDLGIISPNPIKSFKAYKVSNTGLWSTKNYLPMCLIQDKKYKQNYLFQIESSTSWNIEVGDFTKNITLNLSGPTLQENAWSKKMKPNEEFESVSCAITSSKTEEGVFENITNYRRLIISRTQDHKELPIIFNEYMFASWNEPSFETASKLSPIAKEVGADYFVIDCGWHDEEINPFYHVGRWKESKNKYPEGLNHTLDYIRSLGLKVGLWMEPEVIGYLGNAKELYDDECFFQRNGKSLIISNRYQLDLRNKKVYNKLLDIFNEIMNKYNLDYIKFDYNIEPGIGTDLNTDSLGNSLLEYGKAYHNFINEIGNRYPNLIIESCASGGNRMDYYTLSNVNLTSTSDQTNYALYPYIISNLLTSVLPEQAGIWSYPYSLDMKEEDIDEECVAMNMTNSLIGRMHLASKLYLLNDKNKNMVKKGIECYRYLSQYRENCTPYYPIGLSKYNDKSLAFGYKKDNKAILFVYNMKEEKDIIIPLKKVKTIKLIYPLDLKTEYKFKDSKLIYKPYRKLIARVFELEFEN